MPACHWARSTAGRICTEGLVLAVSLPGLGGEEKRVLVDAAHQICPHSRAIKDNVDVRFELI